MKIGNPYTINHKFSMMSKDINNFQYALIFLLYAIVISDDCSANEGIVTVSASNIQQIELDGYLDDWPSTIPEHLIGNSVLAYGPSDIDLHNKDISIDSDLSPYFMIGYNLNENLIYVAVRVKDDVLIIGSNPWNTDACEIYISTNLANSAVEGEVEILPTEDLPILQYVSVPGMGTYDKKLGNPSLFRGEIDSTRTRVAYRRHEEFTIYEWAVEVFDQYPSKPVILKAGLEFGFDVVVVDKDGDTDTPAWVCWGPKKIKKYEDSMALGRLVLK